MPVRLVNIDRSTPMFLPPDLRDWVPQDHLVHFVLDAVEALPLSQFRLNHRGTGSEQYPPRLLLALLIYSYATGTFASRQIEALTHYDVAVRFLCANTHPDHDTLCTFRRQNKALLQETFVQVLQLAAELKLVRVGTVAIDGTKVLANASKHSAVSYERAGQLIAELKLEVAQLMQKAETADSTPLQDGLTIPAEIARRQQRQAQLEQARRVIEQRAQDRAQAEQSEYQAKLAARRAKEERGEKPGGRPPSPPDATPGPKDQYNFTDPESRIMKAGSSGHFEQAYNAQAAVDTESMLIVGQHVSQAPNDKQQLQPTLASIPAEMGRPTAVLVDSGFYSEGAVRAVEVAAEGTPTGTTVYAAQGRQGHHRSVADLEVKPEPPAPPAGASLSEEMHHRIQSSVGQRLYRLRKQTVEPVFGIIKEVLGFRRFLLRGWEKVSTEWTLVSVAWNLKRLAALGMGAKLAARV
jgi:transposase